MRRLMLIIPLTRTAIRSLMLHKLRSFLTMLGLVFGVASVIVMLAIAEGASFEAQQQIESLGVRNIIVRSKKPIEDTESGNSGSEFVLAYGLTWDDLDRINATIKVATGATPLREFRKEIRHLNRSLEGRVVGATADYLELTSSKLQSGRFLQPVDVSSYQNVCVIGSELADKLFPYENPLQKTVRIGANHFYRIVGVTEYRSPTGGAGSSLSAEDYNRDVYIPVTTDRARFGEMIVYETSGSQSFERIELSQITVQIDDRKNVQKAATAIEDLLAAFHTKQDFSVIIPLELLKQAEQTQRIFSLLLGSTAGISLLVGGIGIMNIMLATVTERTREIGIRRALGAKRGDIISQFLIETALLSLAGAMLGAVLGLAVPSAVSWMTGRVTIITPFAPLLAVGVAFLVGTSFGVYPARRAAMLHPIEALRNE
ncbi:ABC transporter permease [Fuerstiella marisgermanici]|uniref:Macrolide export ATP-binding/permease protein MacB n=1 Tax=Fuerstiella marisgermanici TaxID=1891926 RepID=A0A1P8WNM0_9PLAN|nr:ABC transporter permease [Fuerstiella marisgermanici]APZ95635.1 Macrolide export ATP-binding/permease protein MacB [Fuerstiella marisgermanici]